MIDPSEDTADRRLTVGAIYHAWPSVAHTGRAIPVEAPRSNGETNVGWHEPIG